jgi:hypothetical protein
MTAIYPTKLRTALALALTAGTILAAGAQTAAARLTEGVRTGNGDDPYLAALQIRSAALNELYGLGDRSGTVGASAAEEPAWLRALRIRSEALNERYGLGDRSEATGG